MLNPWNDLIKQETNNNNVNPHDGMIYDNNNSVDPSSLMMLGNNGGTGHNNMVNNGMPPMDVSTGHIPSQAQVAAAVATAMMMQNQNNGLNNANMSGMDDCMDDDDCGDSDEDCGENDAEGVWSPDIEQSFQEALAIYPPCGRRKIILSEEGKMYGRNELIARYIKVRTGKSRSRKQVSSHIQVLAKRKTKDFHTTFKDEKTGKCTSAPVNGFNNPFSHLTSAQIISPTPMPAQNGPQMTQQNNHNNTQNNQNQQNQQFTTNQRPITNNTMHHNNNNNNQNPMNNQNNQMLLNQQQRTLTNSHNTHNHHHNNQNQQQLHNPQMLQNCTNILPNMNNNNNIMNNQSCSIWGHPGLQPEKKARLDLIQQQQTITMPTSPTQINNNNNQILITDEIIPSSSSSSSSSSASNSSSNHHTMGQASPESVSPANQSGLASWSYNKNAESKSFNNKCIMGLHQLRLIEFSGFLEQRNDPEIYNKHLFVHLNTSDYFSFNNNNSNTIKNIDLPSPTDDFELINYKEFADKFPENDLLWSIANANQSEHPKVLSPLPGTTGAVQQASSNNSAAYLIKFWVDLNYTLEENVSSLYAVTNIFESPEALSISCSTKVCSFGNQVVEKVETEHARYENGRCSYRIENSPMCEYMITFINKLKQLPEKNLKNSVLENFSVLQLIKNNDTQELLLTLAYVFEVSTSEHGAQHNVYKLTNK